MFLRQDVLDFFGEIVVVCCSLQQGHAPAGDEQDPNALVGVGHHGPGCDHAQRRRPRAQQGQRGQIGDAVKTNLAGHGLGESNRAFRLLDGEPLAQPVSLRLAGC